MVCLARYNAFPTMMTGNLLKICETLADSGLANNASFRLPAPVFYILIICWRHFGIFCHHVARRRTQSKMVILTVMILVSTFMAEAQPYWAGERLVPVQWNVWLIAFGFGVQSAVTFPTMGVPTMMATGHLTNVMSTWTEVLLGEKPRTDLQKLKYPHVNLFALCIGALVGALANKYIERGTIASHFLLTPIVVLQVIFLVLLETLYSGECRLPQLAIPATRTNEVEFSNEGAGEDD